MIAACAADRRALTTPQISRAGQKRVRSATTLVVSAPIRLFRPPKIRFSGAITMEPSRPTRMDMTPARIAMPSSGQKRPLVMAQLSLRAIFSSANVIGTTRLRRTASQMATATRARPASTAGRISQDAPVPAARPAKRPTIKAPPIVTTNIRTATNRVAPRTRSSSRPRRR